MPSQPAGMVAAVVSDGTTVAAGYLTGSGSRAALTSTGRSQLERIAGSRTPLTLDLDGLGRYRVLAARAETGTTSSSPACRWATSTPRCCRC